LKQSNTAAVVLAVLFFLAVVTGGGLLLFSDVKSHPYRLLIAIFLLLSAASILARPLVYVLTRSAGGLLFPGRHDVTPKPAYSLAQARRIKGDYEAALQLYATIAGDFPQEIAAWRSMLEIALENIKDEERARQILERGLSVLKNERYCSILQTIYDEGTVPVSVRRPIPLY
jgi:tetratricopeptide (TPR) repeat protein